MERIGKPFVSKRVITYEYFSFLFIILIIWLDEILDLPSLFFASTKKPITPACSEMEITRMIALISICLPNPWFCLPFAVANLASFTPLIFPLYFLAYFLGSFSDDNSNKDKV